MVSVWVMFSISQGQVDMPLWELQNMADDLLQLSFVKSCGLCLCSLAVIMDLIIFPFYSFRVCFEYSEIGTYTLKSCYIFLVNNISISEMPTFISSTASCLGVFHFTES